MTATAKKPAVPVEPAPLAPSGDNILILTFPSPKVANGIALPDDVNLSPDVGRVIAVGPGLYGMTGYCPMEYAPGDIVYMFADRPFERVPIDGREYFIIRQMYLKGKMTTEHPDYDRYRATKIEPGRYNAGKPLEISVPMGAGLALPN